MREMTLKARAKINLGLDVLRKREDGYHELRMIMQTVGLHDKIYLKRTYPPGIRVQTNLGFLPVGEDNLVYKAAKLLLQGREKEEGVFIDLKKHIPVAAGLAGGSSDAAAVLVGVNRMFELSYTREQLMELAVQIGADVPYCVLRGTALAEGIGEKLTVLRQPPACKVLLAKPAVHVSTRFVYAGLQADRITEHPDIDGQIQALQNGDLPSLAEKMGNVLETVTVKAHPVIGTIREKMLDAGALGARMSGSGPTVFGLFEDNAAARKAYEALHGNGLARQVYLTEPWFSDSEMASS